MSAKLLGVIAICCFGFTLPALAQLDSARLRAKYGSPLNRETFHMPAGFDLIVDYGSSHQACKLEVPALMPTQENPSNTSFMTQRMHDFLEELVPPPMRGKLSRHVSFLGSISVAGVDYEHVLVNEYRHGNERIWDDTITLMFKNSDCHGPN